MVTPTIYNTSEEGRRYSRACPPYPLYPDRRFQLQSHHDIRVSTMTEREHDESKEPRKRIAVACGRCRKRKIRCSGDPGNGAPCSNCKNAGHEPCLFLRVSSTETPLRDGPSDFGYTMDAARAYQARGSASSHNAISQYATDMTTGDMMAYRSSAYPYNGSSSSSSGGKSYYSSVSGWGAGGFGEDSVDYGLNYSYPHMSSDPVHMVSGCRYGSSTKAPPVYVDSEASSYTYGNLVHRPATGHELPTLSLSGMATTLTTATTSPDRVPTIIKRNNFSSTSTYRRNGIPGHYGSTGSKNSSVHSSDVGYNGLGSGFDTPVTYGSTSSIPANMSGRSGHADTSFAPSSAHHGLAAATAAAGDSIYGSDHSSYRTLHDSDSYIYSDRLDGSRRDSHSSAGGASAGSVLSNGQVYVPDTQSHASASAAAHGYSVSAAAAAATSSANGAPPASVAGTGRTSAAMQTAGHRRSGGNLRSS